MSTDWACPDCGAPWPCDHYHEQKEGKVAVSIPAPSIPDQDVEELIEQALEEVGKACTPKWNKVCMILAELYEIYCKRVEEVDVVEYYRTVDRLMQAYDNWLG